MLEVCWVGGVGSIVGGMLLVVVVVVGMVEMVVIKDNKLGLQCNRRFGIGLGHAFPRYTVGQVGG